MKSQNEVRGWCGGGDGGGGVAPPPAPDQADPFKTHVWQRQEKREKIKSP